MSRRIELQDLLKIKRLLKGSQALDSGDAVGADFDVTRYLPSRPKPKRWLH